jgi:N-acetylneuraminic acid mutarotase
MGRALLALCLLLFGTVAGTVETKAAPSLSRGNGAWSTAASMITGRENQTATLLRNGNVLVLGGMDGHGAPLASAEVYNPKTNRWTAAPAMATTRVNHSATLMADGRVLVAGGIRGSIPSETLASAEIYDPAANTWSEAAPMVDSRSRHTATLLGDGRVLVVGGFSVKIGERGLVVGQPTDAEVYDPLTNRWSTTPPMARYRREHTATLLNDGRVLVAGSQDDLTFNSTEIYDPTSSQWVAAAPMTSGRALHSAVRLANGEVLVVGGISQGQNSPAIELASAEIYNPSTNRWTAVASMTQARTSETTTVLGDGRVLVLGAGFARGRPELYDPARNSWSIVGPPSVRSGFTATRLQNGRALVVGGYGAALSSVLQYDPDGVAPTPSQPIDMGTVAAALLLVLAAVAWSVPAVRRRVLALRPDPDSEEWITS